MSIRCSARGRIRLIARDMIFGIPARLRADGSEAEAPDLVVVARAVARAKANGAAGIIVSFLHSWRNGAHEEAVKQAIARIAPELFVFTSCEVWPVIREYERTTTAILNGYVHPRVSGYLTALEEKLRSHGVTAPALLTKSNGGVMNADEGKRSCVQMLLSGTASGVIGAAWLARRAGEKHILTLDIGGTSADFALIIDGEPQFGTGEPDRRIPAAHPVRRGQLDRYRRRFDRQRRCAGRIAGRPGIGGLHTRSGLLRSRRHAGHRHRCHGCLWLAGPQPDGLWTAADRRGARPRRRDPAGGKDRPYRGRSGPGHSRHRHFGNVRRSGEARLARRRRSPRIHPDAVWRGGPMLGAFLAREFKMAKVIGPPRPGVVSALGGLVADLRGDFIRTVFTHLSDEAAPRLRDALEELAVEGRKWLSKQGHAGTAVMNVSADMRYVGQSFEIEVPIQAAWIDEGKLGSIEEAFHAMHARLYDFHDPEGAIEIVNLRLSAIGAGPALDLPVDAREGRETIEPEREIPVFTGKDFEWIGLYPRDRLTPGSRFAGPAVVAQEDTTFAIPGGAHVEVDRHLNLHLTFSE